LGLSGGMTLLFHLQIVPPLSSQGNAHHGDDFGEQTRFKNQQLQI
jgi:hypothetical protein